MALYGVAIRMLILLNLLAQCGSVVSQVFQRSLNLCDTLHPGLALCSSGLANAGGPDVRGTDNTQMSFKMNTAEYNTDAQTSTSDLDH